jgi:hypothetical protein
VPAVNASEPSATQGPPASTRREVWGRIRAERRRRDLKDTIRQALELSDELEFLSALLDPDSPFHEDDLTPKTIALRVEEAAVTVVGLAYALSDRLDGA